MQSQPPLHTQTQTQKIYGAGFSEQSKAYIPKYYLDVQMNLRIAQFYEYIFPDMFISID